MSRPSEKALMREALLLTEGNLSSLIAARHCDYILMRHWRDQVRKALGNIPILLTRDEEAQA